MRSTPSTSPATGRRSRADLVQVEPLLAYGTIEDGGDQAVLVARSSARMSAISRPVSKLEVATPSLRTQEPACHDAASAALEGIAHARAIAQFAARVEAVEPERDVDAPLLVLPDGDRER